MDVDTQEITNAIENQEDSHVEQPQDNNENADLEAKENTDDLVDLDSLEKFRWDGKEYTREELGKMAMRQSDYTQKTQALAEEKKFAENFVHDFNTLQRSQFDPQVVAKFKEIYPEKYHAMIDRYVSTSETSKTDANANLKSEIEKIISPHLKDLESIKQEAYEKKVEAESKWLDNQYSSLGKKYPYANEELVNSKLIAMLDHAKSEGKNLEVNEKMLEKIFQQENDSYKKRVDEINSRQAKEQLQANESAFDTSGRGGSPTMQRKTRTLDEATEDAIASLTNN